MYQMMLAYGNGNGVEQNNSKAFEYGLKCAKNGDATCMWNVINCYSSGMGVERELVKMLEWSTRLGKLENRKNLTKSGYITSIRLQLAQRYRKGKDVAQDVFKSYLWYLIYNEFKVDFSILKQGQVIKEIKDLESELTLDQKNNGKKEAEKLFGKKLKNVENLYIADF